MCEEVLTRTTLKISQNICHFESTIESTCFKVIETIKKWNKENMEKIPFHFQVVTSISIQDKNVYDSVTIRGYVQNDLYSVHTISNRLYVFFEYIMNECNQKTISWILNNEMYTISKLYKYKL